METFTENVESAENQNLTFKQKLALFLQNKKRVLLIGLGITALAIISLFLLLAQSPTLRPPAVSPVEPLKAPQPETAKLPPETTEKLPQDLIPPEELQILELPVKPAPQVSFEKYQLATTHPTLPNQITLYTFKTDYFEQEIKDFAAKFGLFDIQSISSDFIIAKNLDSPKDYGHLVFNKKTGAFSFHSFGIHKPRFSSLTNPSAVARAFLNEKGLIDETITTHATYQIKGIDDVTFVEFHRGWNQTGLPIFNIVGLLNLDETIKLADLRLGTIDQKTPDNELIINTSDDYNGKERPNDFGTITVAVLNDGTIFSIESNLRQIEKSQTITDTLLTPQQAFENIEKGSGLFQLTIPSGEGIVDFNRVYPNNLAQAKSATVTDFVIAYLEKPPAINQSFLQPVYFFKGKAILDSGYQVNWVQAIPSIASTANILGDTIEFGSFTPPPTPTPTSTPTPIPTPTLSLSRSRCNPNENQLNNIIELSGLGKVGTFNGSYGHQYYFLPPQDQSLPSLELVLEEFKKLGISARMRAIHKIRSRDWNKNPNCPKRLTGSTPTLFVYAPEKTQLTIKPDANITYSNPPLANNVTNFSSLSWQIAASPDGALSPITYPDKVEDPRSKHRDNLEPRTYSYLYYEYEPVSFTKPKNGWIIKKSNLKSFARNVISPQLKLTALEENRLVFELNHASFDLSSNCLFIGLIDQKEIDKKLPLEINPKPNTLLRYHFYVSPVSSSCSSAIHCLPLPKLSPILRSDFMIIELGAIGVTNF